MPNLDTIDGKIDYLADVYQNDDEARVELNMIRKRITEISKQKSFKNHPCTIEMRDYAMSELQRIDNILRNKEDLSDNERRQLFADKRAHLKYLEWLNPQIDKDMQFIERSINERIKEI